MGAIFNTPGTRAILEMLHKAYNDQLKEIRKDVHHAQDLQDNTIDSYTFCGNYGLLTNQK